MRYERRRSHTLREQAGLFLPLVVLWALGAAAVAFFALQERVSRRALFLDTNTTAGLPWYTGLVSNVGILVWAVGATLAFAGGYAALLGGRPRAAQLMIEGGILGAILCFDDLFQFHSALVPDHTPLPKAAVLAGFATLAIVWLRRNRHELARTRWQILVAALGALMISVVVDHFNRGSDKVLILEDGPKLLGILAWAMYFALVGRDVTRSIVLAREGAAVGAP